MDTQDLSTTMTITTEEETFECLFESAARALKEADVILKRGFVQIVHSDKHVTLQKVKSIDIIGEGVMKLSQESSREQYGSSI